MTAFGLDGVAPERWTAKKWWRNAPSLALPPSDTHLVVLAAHADDETLGVGGLIHAASGRLDRITVVIASDGAASHPASPSHSPHELAKIRSVEASAALSVLAPNAEVHQLGLPDGQLTAHVPQIAQALEAILGADTDSWLLSTWLDDPHPDHAACALAARDVASRRSRTRLFEYPIWFWHVADPEQPRPTFERAVRRFGLTSLDRAVRARALTCYPSQTQPLSDQPGDEALLPAGLLAHFDREILLDLNPRPASDATYFDELYAQADDPWQLADSWYEQRKRDVVLAALPRKRFRRCFEPGCARGDLSQRLVNRVDQLVCADGSAAAVAAARTRLPTSVIVEQLQIPGHWPTGTFDLIVLSEVAYYVEDLNELSIRITESLDEDGVLVLVHWRRAAPDHPHTAETVHATLRATTALSLIARHEEDDFVLDVLARDPRSVAHREGIV